MSWNIVTSYYLLPLIVLLTRPPIPQWNFPPQHLMAGKPRRYPVVRAHKSHSQKIEFDQKLVPSSHWMIPSSPGRTRRCTIRCIIPSTRHPVCRVIPSSRWICCLTICRIKRVVPSSRPSFWLPTVILAVPFKPTLITNSRMSKS